VDVLPTLTSTVSAEAASMMHAIMPRTRPAPASAADPVDEAEREARRDHVDHGHDRGHLDPADGGADRAGGATLEQRPLQVGP
jgi:hypothetical protein